MKVISYLSALIATALLGACTAPSVRAQAEPPYTQTFNLNGCQLEPRGVNPYFIPLLPGHYLLLSGVEEDDEGEEVTLTVLIQVMPGTKMVDGTRCAIVREMEWEDEDLVEVSHNYFAICRSTKAIFYFGEDVDDYEDGVIVGHGGAWLAGENGNLAGLIMPGMPLVGSRYYQEIAPGVALDRAEHLDNDATVETPSGRFTSCLSVAETTPLNPGELSLKAYAPGIGLIHDDVISLVDHGRRPVFGEEGILTDDDEE